jgi:hypothetical protein
MHACVKKPQKYAWVCHACVEIAAAANSKEAMHARMREEATETCICVSHVQIAAAARIYGKYRCKKYVKTKGEEVGRERREGEGGGPFPLP